MQDLELELKNIYDMWTCEENAVSGCWGKVGENKESRSLGFRRTVARDLRLRDSGGFGFIRFGPHNLCAATTFCVDIYHSFHAQAKVVFSFNDRSMKWSAEIEVAEAKYTRAATIVKVAFGHCWLCHLIRDLICWPICKKITTLLTKLARFSAVYFMRLLVRGQILWNNSKRWCAWLSPDLKVLELATNRRSGRPHKTFSALCSKGVGFRIMREDFLRNFIFKPSSQNPFSVASSGTSLLKVKIPSEMEVVQPHNLLTLLRMFRLPTLAIRCLHN